MKSGFLNRLLARAEKVDKEQIVDYMVEIAQERDLLVLIFNSMIEGMIVIDEDENVVLINQSARNILELGDGPTAPLIPFSKLIRNRDLLRLCNRGINSEEPILEHEYKVLFDEEERYLELNMIPLQNNDERHGTMFLFIDETEQKEQERRLREAEKLAALTTMSAGVSHEIRNPLNSLSIHLQLLKRELKKSGVHTNGIKDTIEVFEKEINRLNDVIETFLSAVKPSKPVMKIIQINRLLTDTLTLMEPEFRENEIRVSLREEGNWPLVKADESQLKQAFINILRNAIDAVLEREKESEKAIKKEVLIRMTREQDSITITFIDSGKGINEGDITHIFDPYFTTKPKGTGLGLMIVDRIVREHHGILEAQSESGAGTQISITLPIAAESPKLLEHESNST